VALVSKRNFNPTIAIFIHYKKKQVAQLKLKSPMPKKTDDELQVSTKLSVYTRDQLLVTDFWRVRKLILSSIIITWWRKKIPFREAAGTLNKKIIDSLQRI
jgi:hypothetical protein